MATGVAVTFIVYLVFLLATGFYFYRRSATIEDYLLGGRSMGAWVTALSAQASDMSGWLLMGLPGALYLSGLVESWIAIGLFVGTVLNWLLVAGRLRIYTEKTNSITLPGFIANCATIVVVNSFTGQKDTRIFEEFRQVKIIIREGKP